MRPPSIVRITIPTTEFFPPQPERDAAAALMAFAGLHDEILSPLLDPPLRRGLTRAERHVLASLPARKPALARDLAGKLAMDKGHLSRILARLEARGMILRLEAHDGRHWPLKLTAAGRLERLRLNRAGKEAMALLLQPLSMTQRNELAAAAIRVHDLLLASAGGNGFRAS